MKKRMPMQAGLENNLVLHFCVEVYWHFFPI